MNKDVIPIFLVLLALYLVQALGGLYQIKSYKKAIRRLHLKGNVGIGQKKGRLFNGSIAIISCDSEGVITGCEVLDGVTFISRFHKVDQLLEVQLVGASIYNLYEKFNQLDKKRKNYYKGYINALTALKMRLERKDQQSNNEEGISQSSFL